MVSLYDQQIITHLRQKCSTAKGSHARGAALEDLVEYMFTQIPSVKLFQRDVKDESGAQEVDLVFSHLVFVSMLPMPDVAVMVECKNEKKKTSAAQIREFGSKLKSRSMPIGIFVTTAGLSGPVGKCAHSAIRDTLSEGIAVIVVTTDELSAAAGVMHLVDLLRGRLIELRTFRGYKSI